MDFDIGNLLYVVIMLVAVIVSLLGKKKKPADSGSGAPAGETRSGFLENLERVLTMDQEQTRIQDLRDYEADLPAEEYAVDNVVEQYEPEPPEEQSLMERYEQLVRQRSGFDGALLMSEGGNISKPLEVIDLDEVSGTNYFEIINDFDAGAAVVYSAIINRLDY